MRVLILVLALAMTGCAALKTASWLLPSADGIEADVTVGKKEEVIATQVGNSTEQVATIINNANDIPLTWIVIGVFLAGFAIPSPLEMFRGLKQIIKELFLWR